jgi:hypothetical protein
LYACKLKGKKRGGWRLGDMDGELRIGSVDWILHPINHWEKVKKGEDGGWSMMTKHNPWGII